MTRGAEPEQQRALLQRALDGELDAEERALLQQALSADPTLAAEFEALQRLKQATAELSEAVPSVDVLAGVQAKLRARSGGRFYRDRFAETQGRGALLTWVIFASVLVVLATVIWFLFLDG